MTHSRPADSWRTIIVDDEPLARQALRVLLSRERDFAIVAECSHGAGAVAAIRGERPDVLFLDVQMPEVDGFEVARRLVAERSPQRRPWIIALTANAVQGDREQCLQAGMDDYLTKPVTRDDLSRALERARTARAARR